MPIAHISNRSCLLVSGPDAKDFLQGLITQDMNLLDNQDAIYACFLTPQGKFLHDFLITRSEDSYFLEVLNDEVADLTKRLMMYKLRSNVDVRHASALKIYAAWAEKGKDDLDDGYRDPRHPKLGARCVTEDALSADADFADYDAHRITLTVPDGARDCTPKLSTLYDANMDKMQAISFDKGCFLGQELTARIHYRGLVKKRLFTIEGEGTLTSGHEVMNENGRSVGQIFSATGSLGLAILKVDAADNDALTDGKHQLTVRNT